MALDTFDRIANQCRMRCPAADILLARDWVNHAFRRVAERRPWSWLIKFGQFVSQPIFNTGTVSLTSGSATVTGVGTGWNGTLVGRQFRVGFAAPIYTILSVESATSMTLDSVWGYVSLSNVTYMVYDCFFTVPSDFLAFQTVYDPRLNWQLHLNSTQQEINQWDAQRASVGLGYAVVSRDYVTTYNGSISQPVQIAGSGAIPTSTGQFTGPSNQIFTVQISTGGTSGTAQFIWKAGGGAYSAPIVSSTGATTLQQGVNVYFGPGTYVLNDTFVIQCQAIPQVGLPRFEIWPHFQGQYNWPFMYVSRAIDLEDFNAVLPRTIRGDVLLEMALAEAAGWPGVSDQQPNKYYNPVVQARHQRDSEKMVAELERQDDEIFEQDVNYSMYLGLPWAPFPFADASYIQSHDVSGFI